MNDEREPRKPRNRNKERADKTSVDLEEGGDYLDGSDDKEKEVVEDRDPECPHGEETSEVGNVVDVRRSRAR